MTTAAAPEVVAPPPPPWLADPKFLQADKQLNHCMAMLADEPGLRTYVLREAGKRVAEWLKTQHDTMWEALPLKLAPPQERLQVYLTQYDDARWDMLMLKWPRWYEKLRRDFDRLKLRAQRGDWTEEDEAL